MFKTIPKIQYLLILGIVFLSCQTHDKKTMLTEIPLGFAPYNIPEDNEFSIERWTLGKKLFYDPILSLDSTISCASCHKQHLGFADHVPKTNGILNRAGKRNAPTLANVAYLPHVLFEGSVPTLEMQILVPIQEHNEFNHNIVAISNQLQHDSIYIQMSKDAYNRKPDPFVITRAISNFQRTLISGNSLFDQYKYHNNKTALSDAQIRGEKLFFGNKTNCSNCHSNFTFSDFSFKNNGIKEKYLDEGRYHFTGKKKDLNTFKVPTLRNIEVTGPYMHDGSFETLKDVIEHYNSGGYPHINKSEFIKPLFLSDEEKTDLEEFLKSLTDKGFLENTLFNP